jgi:hypothetical protein
MEIEFVHVTRRMIFFEMKLARYILPVFHGQDNILSCIVTSSQPRLKARICSNLLTVSQHQESDWNKR